MKKLFFFAYAVATVALMGWGYYQAIYVAPTDAMQGEIFRIIFYHVPLFISTLSLFAISFLGLYKFFYRFATAAPTGRRLRAWPLPGAKVMWFITPSPDCWPHVGRRAWGIWWTWDARLTTTLLLWLIYVSYLLLRRFAAGPQVQTLAAVLGIFGALDVPIVYMSNRWWRTQHPAPVFGGDPGSGMDKSMLIPFMWNLAAWLAWAILLLGIRYYVERQHQKYAEIEALEALSANS